MKCFFLLFVCSFQGFFCSLQGAIPVKVVVVSMYEIGEDKGDIAGEFQRWAEREDMSPIPAPLGWRNYYLSDQGLLVMATGGGQTNAAASIMALCTDPRFDLSSAYWIVAGIAGADPEDASLGSAAWATYLVDGDLAKEIDAREIPEDWPYGMLALGAKQPNTLDDGWQVETIAFELNSDLAYWAWEQSRNLSLMTHPELTEFSEEFSDTPAARAAPTVMIGDSLASSTYWHGHALTKWANDWVRLHTQGKGNFVMTNMEDTGTATALFRAGKAGLVDPMRLMVLRTASNFSRPPKGKGVAWSLNAPYPAMGEPALENAYRIASHVAEQIIQNWDTFQDQIPSP